MFLTMMVVGLVGLVMMALPAFGGHHLPPIHGHGHDFAAGGSHDASVGAAALGGAAHAHPVGLPAHGPTPHPGQALLAGAVAGATSSSPHAGRRFIPSPRAVFSLLAIYGASGNALVHAGHLSRNTAALLAVGPALLIEWFLIRPVWRLMFRYKADASSPLEELILADAQAVVPFRNGRGLITTVRDGRRIQLQARLCDRHASQPVAFGQRLRIEDVDARRERVTVSVFAGDETNDKPT